MSAKHGTTRLFNRAVLTAAACIVITACGTSPVSHSGAKPTEVAANYATPFTDSGVLVISRDSGFICFAATVRVFIDGTEAAGLGTGEKAVLYTQPGEHIIGVTANALCAGGTAQTSVSVASGREKYVRTGFSQNGVILVEPSAF